MALGGAEGIPLANWHSGHVVASAVASLHEQGFPTADKLKGMSRAGGGTGDSMDDIAAAITA